jgi:hypothetical protein
VFLKYSFTTHNVHWTIKEQDLLWGCSICKPQRAASWLGGVHCSLSNVSPTKTEQWPPLLVHLTLCLNFTPLQASRPLAWTTQTATSLLESSESCVLGFSVPEQGSSFQRVLKGPETLKCNRISDIWSGKKKKDHLNIELLIFFIIRQNPVASL